MLTLNKKNEFHLSKNNKGKRDENEFYFFFERDEHKSKHFNDTDWTLFRVRVSVNYISIYRFKFIHLHHLDQVLCQWYHKVRARLLQ